MPKLMMTPHDVIRIDVYEDLLHAGHNAYDDEDLLSIELHQLETERG